MAEIRPEILTQFASGPAEPIVAEARNLVRIHMDHMFALQGVELLGDAVDEKLRAELEGAIFDAFRSAMQKVLEQNILQLRALAGDQNRIGQQRGQLNRARKDDKLVRAAHFGRLAEYRFFLDGCQSASGRFR